MTAAPAATLTAPPLPWLVLPIVIGSRYDFTPGVVSGIFGGALLWLGLAIEGVLRADFMKVHGFPLAGMILVGGICGAINAGSRKRLLQISTRLDHYQDRLRKLDVDLLFLREAKAELERLLATKDAELATLDGEIRRHFESQGDELFQDILLLLDRQVRVSDAAVYTLASPVELRRRAALGRSDALPDRLGTEDVEMVMLALQLRKPVSTPDFWQRAGGSPKDYLLAVPLLGSRDPPFGVLRVTGMPFLSLTKRTVHLVVIICRWASRVVEIRAQPESVSRVVPGADGQRIFPRAFFEENLRLSFESYRRHNLPLWTLWRALPKVPAGKIFHAPAAGYAGWIGAVAARQRRAPFLLTEHDIYTTERIAEISQAEWIHEADRLHISFSGGLGRLKRAWINLFTFLGQVAYDTAARIVTLYEGNAATQVEFGADERRITVISNGIEPGRFDAVLESHQRRWQTEPARKFVGFIGRVVPIKEVTTRLRAARRVIEKCPEAEFLIAGPYQEDPIYYDECRRIVEMLGIENRVHFLGMQKVLEILPKMDVIVLTSISEGLPLVVIEGFAAGKPCVATDVGACRELLFGRTSEDRALGRAGRLTKILSPAETAAALVDILSDPGRMRRMRLAGRRRAEQFYSMSSMLGAYRDLYAVLPREHQARLDEVHLRRATAGDEVRMTKDE